MSRTVRTRPSAYCQYGVQLLGIVLLFLLFQASKTVAAPTKARVISTDAAVTQILFALGADPALVAIDVTSNLPAGYRELPQVGYHRALSAEGLLSLEPSLVIGSDHMGPPHVITALASAGVSILQLRPAHSIVELKSNINAIAVAIARTTSATPILERLDRQSNNLSTRSISGKKVALILSVDRGKLRIAGKNTSAQAFIELLGASNIAAFSAYRTLASEALLELAPDIILIAGHEGATPERLLKLNPILNHSGAAKNNLILPVNAANLVAGLSLGAITDAANLASQVTQALAAQ